MSADDFQTKFLRIGFSKRKETSFSGKGRNFIGRKGIGKLALLSCSESITILSKKPSHSVTGGIINNPDLDNAISKELELEEYQLQPFPEKLKGQFDDTTLHGTRIIFERIHSGINHTPEFIKQIIALYFRFSLFDPDFNIFVDGEKISIKHLGALIDQTQFLWEIGQPTAAEDDFIHAIKDHFIKHPADHKQRRLEEATGITGFIASVKKPRDLSIFSTGERLSIDLFVNGRLRERNILRHMPTARVPESYLYGQLHFNSLDEAGDDKDRFTSNREGVISDDPKFQEFLKSASQLVKQIVSQWDDWRLDHGNAGDPDNASITLIERYAKYLFSAISKTYSDSDSRQDSIDDSLKDIRADAEYNFVSYANCFISENLLRKIIRKHNPTPALRSNDLDQVARYKKNEKDHCVKENLWFDIRTQTDNLSYLDMDGLAYEAEQLITKATPQAPLVRSSKIFKPLRNAVAHTARLTQEAKKRLDSERENITARIKIIFSQLNP